MEAPVAESHFECRCGAVEEDGRIRRHCGACGYHTVMPANFCMDCGRAFAAARVVEVIEANGLPQAYVIAPAPPPGGRAWSAEEEAELRDLVAIGCRSREIAEVLGRTVIAIRSRRARMKVVA